MPITIQNQRSVPGYKSACNNIMVHCRNLFELRELADQNITMVDKSGDSLGHRELSAIGKNIQANLLMELSSAETLLESLTTTESVLRGTVAPGVAASASPGPLTAVAGTLIGAAKSLDRLELDQPETAQARRVDRAAIVAELQEYIGEMKQIVGDLEGLEMSLTASKFVGFSDCKTWANAVSTTTEFLTKKYRDKDVYHVPASKLIGA